MGKNKLNVLVNGMGNIGTTLVNLLVEYRNDLEVNRIYVAKRSIQPWNKVDRELLEELGVIICVHNKALNFPQFSDVIKKVDYIFEATANGVGLSNLSTYKKLPNLKGSSAQGSEKSYGIPFMSGVNNDLLAKEKFVNIVSCNTHGSAAILSTFCGERLENLSKADMVVVRRSEDLGNHQRLVSANVVARHLDDTAGTHHSIDVIDMYETMGVKCNLTSSDITTPSQLMHAVRFNITLKKPLEKSIEACISAKNLISTTAKFDSNVVFELGRRYGFNGRIYSHAIILSGNLLTTESTIKGWAFVPQEGNSILSTIHAFILQMQLNDGDKVFNKIRKGLFRKSW